MGTADRRVTAARVSAFVVLVLAVVVLTGAGIARSTVLDRGFYQAVLDQEDAYDRLYDEVLVDPASASVTRDLLARVPVPASVVTANLKTVLPAATVRGLVDDQIANAIGYLRGEQPTLRVTVDLQPVLANIGSLAELYLGDLVADVQGRPAADFPAFLSALEGALTELAAGRRPVDFPTLTLDEATARSATNALVAAVPQDERAQVRPQVEAALATGDAAGALAAVVPFLLGDRAGAAGAELAAVTDGGLWNVVPDLERAGVDLRAVEQARGFTRLALGPIQVIATVLGLAAVALLWLTGSPSWVRRVRVIGGGLAVGGVLAGGVLLVARTHAGELMARPSPSWPVSVNALVDDLQTRAADRLFDVGLLTAAVPTLVGVLLVVGAWVWLRARSRRAAPALPRRSRLALASTVGALAVAAVVLGSTVVPVAAGRYDEPRCLGTSDLCERRYDEVAFLATHNAMATTADRFIGPLQDPDITAQLNDGARALLLDTYTWERPDEVAPRLELSGFGPAMRQEILALIDRANPRRPGLWLCHAICRAGAIPLASTLRRIGAWLDANEGEVVTLILQNGITGAETEQAFRDAGVERLLYTPSPDPAAPWPTLGRMVRDGRRLVVFSEHGDGPAPWYRDFYDYAMETPFTFASPEAMSCVPNRGGTGKRLFLLNNFVTDKGGSRIDAGTVNARDFVLDRVRTCEARRGRPVNFVAVDYATIGDAAGAVAVLNATRSPG